MKKSHFYSGLLLTPLPFSADFASLLPTPSAHDAQNNQAVLYTIFKNMHRIPGWQFDDLALLKAIKDSATRLWQHYYLKRKIIRLEEWRRES